MPDSTISALPNSLATPERTVDVLPIDDVSAGETKKITLAQLLSGATAADLPTHTHPFSQITSLPPLFNNQMYAEYFEDFINGSTGNYNGFTSNNNAGNVSIQTPPVSHVIGMARCNTGGTATGRSSICTHNNSFALGIANYDFTVKCRLNNLSDGTNNYLISIGMATTLSATAQHGIFFRYNFANSANWEVVKRVNNVETVFDSGVPVANFNTWVKFRIVSNANFTEEMYIDDVLMTTPSGTLEGSNTYYGFHSTILKTLGTTAAVLDIDYYYLKVNVVNIVR